MLRARAGLGSCERMSRNRLTRSREHGIEVLIQVQKQARRQAFRLAELATESEGDLNESVSIPHLRRAVCGTSLSSGVGQRGDLQLRRKVHIEPRQVRTGSAVRARR